MNGPLNHWFTRFVQNADSFRNTAYFHMPDRGDSWIFLMGRHRGGQDPVRGGPWEKSCAPTQVG